MAFSAQAETFDAKVIAVLDGDTVMVVRDGQKIKIRLANIDAPEVGHAGMGAQSPDSQKDQTFGPQSRDSLLKMVGKRHVRVDSQAVDQYGRIVGIVWVDGLNVNEEQVRRGMAWEYSHYHSDRSYIALQDGAKQARLGLWGQSEPSPPWQWRKAHPSVKTDMMENSSSAAAAHATPKALYDAACDDKKRCAQMSSCEEARFYLTRCGLKSLDENRNGVPCESLCKGKN
jgi:endonuclease YncB( thermonuclease family)